VNGLTASGGLVSGGVRVKLFSAGTLLIGRLLLVAGDENTGGTSHPNMASNSSIWGRFYESVLGRNLRTKLNQGQI
jgi:hypothetical protein